MGLHRKVYETAMPVSVQDLWDFHNQPGAFTLLSPPWRSIEAVVPGALEVGSVQEFKVKQFGLWLPWIARIEEVTPPFGFKDIALKSPFAIWEHHHQFREDGNGSILRDVIDYAAPFGPFGDVANWLFIARDLDRVFKWRHERTLELLTGP